MSPELQQVLVVSTVGAAALFVAASIASRFRRRSDKACGGGCSGCSGTSPSPGEPKAFVGIEQLSVKK